MQLELQPNVTQTVGITQQVNYMLVKTPTLCLHTSLSIKFAVGLVFGTSSSSLPTENIIMKIR